jgi:hypothetical protein
MNIAEAELLDRSMGRFGDTMLRNRMMAEDSRRFDATRAAQADELTQRMKLQREELESRDAERLDRGLDRADMQETRRLTLEEQRAHQQRLETIGKEGNETKRNQMYLEMLGELNKTGQLTEEGLGKMEDAFNKQFKVAGLGVKLFRQAKLPEPTSKDMGNGVRAIYVPGSTSAHVIDDRNVLTDETEDDTGTKTKTQRKVTDADLNRSMVDAETADNGNGPTAQQQRTMSEIMSRPAIPASGRVPRETGMATEPAVEHPDRTIIGPDVWESENAARKAGHRAPDVIKLWINGTVKRVRLT